MPRFPILERVKVAAVASRDVRSVVTIVARRRGLQWRSAHVARLAVLVGVEVVAVAACDVAAVVASIRGIIGMTVG